MGRSRPMFKKQASRLSLIKLKGQKRYPANMDGKKLILFPVPVRVPVDPVPLHVLFSYFRKCKNGLDKMVNGAGWYGIYPVRFHPIGAWFPDRNLVNDDRPHRSIGNWRAKRLTWCAINYTR